MKYLVIFGLVVHVATFAQDTKLAVKKSKEFTEEFYVLTSDETVLHGSYVKYSGLAKAYDRYDRDLREPSMMITILEAGSYKNGLKDGQWQYFHKASMIARKNRLRFQGNYVLGKKNGVWKEYYADEQKSETSFQSNKPITKSDSVDIVIEHNDLKLFQAGAYLNDRRVGDWVSLNYEGVEYQRYNASKSILLKDRSVADSTQLNINRPPVYLGGALYLERLLLNALGGNTSTLIHHLKDSITIRVAIQIDEKGNLLGAHLKESNGKQQINDVVLKTIEVLDKTGWIPALENSNPKAGEVVMVYTLIGRRSKKGVDIRFRLDFQTYASE